MHSAYRPLEWADGPFSTDTRSALGCPGRPEKVVAIGIPMKDDKLESRRSNRSRTGASHWREKTTVSVG
jgi:hypothetical protein